MLLRSLTKHLREQNWFAVALDFVIVVVGILIAFQISSWNEARQDDLIYQQAHLRVIEEANMNLVLAQDTTKLALAYQSTAKDMIQDLENCSPEAGAKDRLLSGLQSLKFFLGVDVRNDATNLILSSDAFLDNLSPADRATLSAYARKLGRVVENVSVDYRYQLDKISVFDIPVLTRTSRVDWGEGFMGVELNASYLEACADPHLGTYLFDRYQHASYELLQAENLAEASRELLTGLVENNDAPREPGKLELETAK